MLKDLKTYLHDFVTMRIDEIGSNVLMKHIVYQELSEELQSTLYEILKYVPEDQRELILDYEEKEQAQAALTVEIMYRQRFNGWRVSESQIVGCGRTVGGMNMNENLDPKYSRGC